MPNIIRENSLWDDAAGKTAFLADTQRVIDIFWITVLGLLGIKKLVKNSSNLLNKYFKNELKTRISAITDDNNDFSLLVKLLYDKGLIKRGAADELTRFIFLLKKNPKMDIDEALLRDTLNKIVFANVKPSVKLRKPVQFFLNGELTLIDILPVFMAYCRKNKIAGEFMHIAWRYMKVKIYRQKAEELEAKLSGQIAPSQAPPGAPAAPVADEDPTDQAKDAVAATDQDSTVSAESVSWKTKMDDYVTNAHLPLGVGAPAATKIWSAQLILIATAGFEDSPKEMFQTSLKYGYRNITAIRKNLVDKLLELQNSRFIFPKISSTTKVDGATIALEYPEAKLTDEEARKMVKEFIPAFRWFSETYLKSRSVYSGLLTRGGALWKKFSFMSRLQGDDGEVLVDPNEALMTSLDSIIAAGKATDVFGMHALGSPMKGQIINLQKSRDPDKYKKEVIALFKKVVEKITTPAPSANMMSNDVALLLSHHTVEVPISHASLYLISQLNDMEQKSFFRAQLDLLSAIQSCYTAWWNEYHRNSSGYVPQTNVVSDTFRTRMISSLRDLMTAQSSGGATALFPGGVEVQFLHENIERIVDNINDVFRYKLAKPAAGAQVSPGLGGLADKRKEFEESINDFVKTRAPVYSDISVRLIKNSDSAIKMQDFDVQLVFGNLFNAGSTYSLEDGDMFADIMKKLGYASDAAVASALMNIMKGLDIRGKAYVFALLNFKVIKRSSYSFRFNYNPSSSPLYKVVVPQALYLKDPDLAALLLTETAAGGYPPVEILAKMSRGKKIGDLIDHMRSSYGTDDAIRQCKTLAQIMRGPSFGGRGPFMKAISPSDFVAITRELLSVSSKMISSTSKDMEYLLNNILWQSNILQSEPGYLAQIKEEFKKAGSKFISDLIKSTIESMGIVKVISEDPKVFQIMLDMDAAALFEYGGPDTGKIIEDVMRIAFDLDVKYPEVNIGDVYTSSVHTNKMRDIICQSIQGAYTDEMRSISIRVMNDLVDNSNFTSAGWAISQSEQTIQHMIQYKPKAFEVLTTSQDPDVRALYSKLQKKVLEGGTDAHRLGITHEKIILASDDRDALILERLSKSDSVNSLEYAKSTYNLVLENEEAFDPATMNETVRATYNFMMANPSASWVLLESDIDVADLFSRAFKTMKKPELEAGMDAYMKANGEPSLKQLLYVAKNKMVTERILSGGLLAVDKALITPNTVDTSALKQALKFNNFAVTCRTRKSKYETWTHFMERVVDIAEQKAKSSPLPDLKVTEISMSEDDLNRLSVEYYDKYHSKGRHGNMTPKFLRVFKTTFSREAYDNFIANHEGTEIIKPAFHGTGSLAASMIMRFGFKILPAGAAKAGRMLGHGIYFSNVVDKASQYVGDSFSRRYGTRGYIIEGEAALGKNNVDYKSAGVGGDHIRSAEWVIYSPGEQYLFHKIYEVELVSTGTIASLRKSLGGTEEEG